MEKWKDALIEADYSKLKMIKPWGAGARRKHRGHISHLSALKESEWDAET